MTIFYISAGQVVSSATVQSGDELVVLSGGQVIDATVDGGGQITVSNGGSAYGVDTNSGATVTVLDGGVADTVSVVSGGRQVVSSGGFASNADLAGGIQYVLAGGVTSITTTRPGGIQYVSAGAVANATRNYGGQEIVYGSSLGGFLDTEEIVYGYASGTTVYGGPQEVFGSADNTYLISAATQIVESGGIVNGTFLNGGFVELMDGASANGTMDFAYQPTGDLQIDGTTMPDAVIARFNQGNEIDLKNIAFDPQGSARLGAGDVLLIDENGATFKLNLDPGQDYRLFSFDLAPDGASGTQVTASGPFPGLGPASTFDDFSGAQGWTSPDFTRLLVADTVQHDSVYVGFGSVGTVMAWGVPGAFPPTLAEYGALSVPIDDFGTAQGYDASRVRGVVVAGSADSNGIAYQQNIVYGQGDAGIFFYRPVSATQQPDGTVVPTYESDPELYADFGRNQGWTSDFNFQIAMTTHATPDIVGFGNAGMFVAPQAFMPGANASQVYLVPGTAALGNAAGWDSVNDVRAVTDQNGKPIDLNGDGITDFIGMGPSGLVFAYGGKDNAGNFVLGPLQTAHITGDASDLGDAQGWNNVTTPRVITDLNGDGHVDIVGFSGGPFTFVAEGQDPATNGGEPFAQFHPAGSFFGASQGWTAATPRVIADVNGDGFGDIVGFGANQTIVSLGTQPAGARFSFDGPNSTAIPDFGYNQGWDSTTFRGVADISGTGRADLVLSGAANTQIWHFF